MELIKIKNTGKQSFKIHHDVYGDFTLAPGDERVAPIQVALVAFGDPKLKDRERELAYQMSRQMFGFYEGIHPQEAWTSEVDDPNGPPGSTVGPLGPQFECYNLDDERVYFVLDNPDGDNKGAERPGVFSAEEQVSQLQTQLAMLTKQMEALTNQQTIDLVNQEIDLPKSEDKKPAAEPTAEKVPAAKKAADAPKPVAKAVGKDKPATSRTGR